MGRILIVDDEPALREALTESVHDLGHEAEATSSGEAALALLGRGRIDAVVLDLRMPDMDALEVLRRMRSHPDAPPIAILTAHATAANTIEAMRLGAFDHLTKPVGREALASVLERMISSSVRVTRGPAKTPQESLIGSSDAMREVQKTIGLLADSGANVLVTGETGTGKELVARAIHDFGARRSAAFIAVNCAAIPGDLMESELFGHVRGAFTGAATDRAGAFREAQGGTLFLDEIGDMDLALQAKILRVLQERIVTPVGGKAVAVDVRVIAATHHDLIQRLRKGEFREDLYYRLHVVPIHLPPLRARIADIIPLAEHFLERATAGKRLSAEAAARLIRHGWPGNVRELKNAMERAAVLVRGDVVRESDVVFLDQAPTVTDPLDWPDEDLPTAVARLEALLIRRALARAGSNRAEAARLLNINRQLLYVKLKRYGFDVSTEEEVSGTPTEGVRQADSDG